MKKWSALSPSTANPAPPQRALPFPLSIRGNAIWKSRASEPLPIHASGFGPLFPCNTREALLSPEEQPPHRNQNVSPILIKKRPDPFLLDQAVFFFFLYGNERQPKSCPPLPTFPLNTPAGSTDEGTPSVQPPHQSKASGKEGGRGRKLLLQKGLPPPVSLLHLTSTRHLPSPYAAQANDILLISLGPLDGGRHDAEALKAETLLAKQQHFIHRLLA